MTEDDQCEKINCFLVVVSFVFCTVKCFNVIISREACKHFIISTSNNRNKNEFAMQHIDVNQRTENYLPGLYYLFIENEHCI